MWIWLSIFLVPSIAVAQTFSSDAPIEQKTWEVLLKLAFPVLMTVVGPSATYYISHWPAPLKYAVASLAGLIVGAAAGSIPAFPLGLESAATVGMTSGATGQALYLAHPKNT